MGSVTEESDLDRTDKAFRNNIKKIWTLEQDEKLKELVSQHGMGWTKIGEVFGERNGKQCRERWYNHLDPAVNKGEWTLEEDRVLFTMQREIGNHWAKITKALPGRTDNAIKNRFNAACRNHSLFVAAATASGASVRDITLYDALHMHDNKTPPVDKHGLTVKTLVNPQEIPCIVQQWTDSYQGSSMTDNSPLGTRSYSPAEFLEANKYQRCDVKPQIQQMQQQSLQSVPQQQLQQLQLLQQRQQQQQLQQLQQQQLAQQQQNQLSQQYQQYQQYQVQQEQQQLHLMQQQQLTQQQRQMAPMATLQPPTTIPRPLSQNINSRLQVPSLDFRNVSLSTNNLDGEPPLTPGLFDRVALATLPNHPKPATIPPTAQIIEVEGYQNVKVEGYQSNQNDAIKVEPYFQPSSLVPLPLHVPSQDTSHVNGNNGNTNNANQYVNNNGGNIYVNNVTNINMYNNNMTTEVVNNNVAMNNYNNNPSNGNNGNNGNNNNGNNNNFNNNTISSTNGSVNGGGFIDFDESIFEDWVSDDTEMDFIDSSDDPCYKSSYDYLVKGCVATTVGFCSNVRDQVTRPYEYDTHNRSSIYEQNTNSNCCGFPLGYSSEILEARRPSLTQQAVQTQPQANQLQMKSAGFTNAVRSLGGRICGPGHVDSSYFPLDSPYSGSSTKIYPGQLQHRDRNYSPMADMQNDQNGFFRNSLDTQGTTSTGSRSSMGGYSQSFQESQSRNTINSYFQSSPAVPSQNNAPSPYMNPIYRFVSSAPPTNNNG